MALTKATGYVSSPKMYDLLIMDFIYDILNTGLAYYVDEEDYAKMAQVLLCISGRNCLVDYADFRKWLPYIGQPGIDIDIPQHRITEDDVYRWTEDSKYRDTE